MDVTQTPDRDFKVFFDQEIEPLLAEVEGERIARRKKANLYSIPLILAAPLLLAGGIYLHLHPFLFLAVPMGLVFAGFAIRTHQHKKFKNLFKDAVFTKICARFGYSYRLEPLSDLPARCRALNLVGSYNRATVEDEITGRVGETDLTLVEADLRYRSSGKSSSTHTIFKGLIVEVALPRPHAGTLLLTDDRGWLADWFKAGRFKGGERVKLDQDPAFEEVFDIWSDRPSEAGLRLDPQFRQRLLELRATNEGKVRLAFQDSAMLVTLASKVNHFEGASIGTSVYDVAHIETMISDLKRVSALVESVATLKG